MRSNSIDRVVVSNTNPHNNNGLWIDTSDGEKNAVLKYKGNPLVGGSGNSGSGVPPMTNEDIGKVLTVSNLQTVTIIPEQVPNDDEFTNCNTQYFKEGTLVKLYVDGELKYEGPVLDDEGPYVAAEYNDGEGKFDIDVYLYNDNLYSDSADKYVQSTFFLTAEIPQMQPKAVWSNPSGESNGAKSSVFPFFVQARLATEEESEKYDLSGGTIVFEFSKECSTPPYAVIGPSDIFYSSEWTINNNKIVYNRYGSEYHEDILTLFSTDRCRCERLKDGDEYVDLFWCD